MLGSVKRDRLRVPAPHRGARRAHPLHDLRLERSGLAAVALHAARGDPGEPVETAVALLLVLWLGQRQTLVPRRRVLVRSRDA